LVSFPRFFFEFRRVQYLDKQHTIGQRLEVAFCGPIVGGERRSKELTQDIDGLDVGFFYLDDNSPRSPDLNKHVHVTETDSSLASIGIERNKLAVLVAGMVLQYRERLRFRKIDEASDSKVKWVIGDVLPSFCGYDINYAPLSQVGLSEF